jgi:hypothetical protein
VSVSSPDNLNFFDTPSWEHNADAPDDETVRLEFSLPENQAQRLQAVAQQLGLPPSTVAERAIEMVCEEVITTHTDDPPPHLHITQYQARLDLLHAVEQADTNADDSNSAPADDPEAS